MIDACHETDVDLHKVRPQRDDVAEVGDSCAGVVDRHLDVRPQQGNRRTNGGVIDDGIVFGDLADDRAGPPLNPGRRRDGSLDRGRTTALQEKNHDGEDAAEQETGPEDHAPQR